MGQLTCGLCLLAILPPYDDWHHATEEEARELPPLLPGAPVHEGCLAQDRAALDQVTGAMLALDGRVSAQAGGAPVPWVISRVDPDPKHGGTTLLVVREGEVKAP